ncbi:MAG: Holliday junction branch migration protein RuvA [Paracoccaceae bacterium]
MIGKITGRLDYSGTDHVLIDTGGVGYLVYCSERTLAMMPKPGGMVALYTELLVREDLLQLFGFPTLAEREWHRLLTTVQGVGAKAALAILGTLGAEGVGRAIALGDQAAIKAAPGIGPKIAQRVVLELKTKAPAIMAMGGAGARSTMASAPDEPVLDDMPAPAPLSGANDQADALSALVNLGYGPGEAAAAVAQAAGGDVSGSAALIRAALRLLAPQVKP